jgi:[lysine-biosynthesis-protein LysW]---L-2-aminoadipate ligase
MSGPPVIAVLASRVRLEERLIFDALARRGCTVEHLQPRDWHADLARPIAPPAVTLIREISFHRASYAARVLEWQGSRTVNPAAVIEVCGDKMRTTLALLAMGLPTPDTTMALTTDAALDACEAMGYPVVVKPLVGSWGRLVTLLPDRPTAAAVLEHRAQLSNPVQHITYLQRFIDKPGRDIRVIVANDEPVAAMYRYANGFRTNIADGGVGHPCPVDGEIGQLAVAAQKAVGGGAVGVDLIEDAEGRLYVLEVNHAVEFRGLQEATGVDVADALVTHALRMVVPG